MYLYYDILENASRNVKVGKSRSVGIASSCLPTLHKGRAHGPSFWCSFDWNMEMLNHKLASGIMTFVLGFR